MNGHTATRGEGVAAVTLIVRNLEDGISCAQAAGLELPRLAQNQATRFEPNADLGFAPGLIRR